MPKKSDLFNLKLPILAKTIVDLYVETNPLKKGKTASGYLRPLILEELNRILDFLEKERQSNERLQKLLKIPENQEVLKALDSNLRF